MKDVWVLSIRTSLPETSERIWDHEPEIFALENFEKARAAFRAKIKELAFSENAIFDGAGKLTEFDDYADSLDDEDDGVSNYLNRNVLTQILKALTAAFGGADTKLEIEDGFYTDWMIAVDVEENSVNFYGYDDGPINGYEPVLKTNIFDMKEEKDYYLYIDNMLGQYQSSELYIDLKKTTVD